MNICTYIFSGLLAVAVALYFIFKKLDKTFWTRLIATFILPLTEALAISAMTIRLPDSKHLILLSLIAYIFSSACIILFLFDKNTNCRVIARTLFLCSMSAWLALFSSTYYIYRIPLLLSIICTLIYISIFVFTFIMLGKQRKSHYFWAVISLLVCSLLHFCSAVTLVSGRTIYSIILFAGTSIVYVLDIFYLRLYKKEPAKNTKFLLSLLLISSQILISVSCFLMIY